MNGEDSIQSYRFFRIVCPNWSSNKCEIWNNDLSEIKGSNNRISNSNFFNSSKIIVFIVIDGNDFTEFKFFVGEYQNTSNKITKYFFERKSDTKRYSSQYPS